MITANTVRNPDIRIMETLAGLAGKYERSWCYPSQAKIVELLARFTGRRLSRRHLNRHLRALERDGMIRRIRRHVRDRSRGLLLRSTVYVLAGRWLARVRQLVNAAARWTKSAAKSVPSLPVPGAAQYGTIFEDLALRGRTT